MLHSLPTINAQSRANSKIEAIELPNAISSIALATATHNRVSGPTADNQEGRATRMIELRQESGQSTLVTSTSAPTTSPTDSVLQATRTESYAPAYPTSTTDENGIDVEAGASGSASGGFSLSRGGMIAIIVVVVTVAVLGILSITLFIVAKRRQWKVRESIKRASRRLTGRTAPKSEAQRRKRSGMVAGAGRGQRAPPGTRLVLRKEGVISETELKDVEKGEGKSSNGWASRLGRNDWK